MGKPSTQVMDYLNELCKTTKPRDPIQNAITIQRSLHFMTPLQTGKYGLKLEVVLNCRDIYTGNIKVVSLISGLKIEVLVKWRGINSKGPLYNYNCNLEYYLITQFDHLPWQTGKIWSNQVPR